MLREEVGPLTGKHRQLVTVLEVARIEVFVRTWAGLPGRPLSDRHALARAFIAKAVLGLPTTSALIERLAVEFYLAPALRMGAQKPSAERIHVLARLRRVCRDGAARTRP